MTGNHAIKLPPQRQQKFDEYLASGAREHQQCRDANPLRERHPMDLESAGQFRRRKQSRRVSRHLVTIERSSER